MFPNHEQDLIMLLLGKNRLVPLMGLDDQTDIWVRGWVYELDNAHWKTSSEILRKFTRAVNVSNDTFLFPVGETGQGIVVVMQFPKEIALVVGLRANSK